MEASRARSAERPLLQACNSRCLGLKLTPRHQADGETGPCTGHMWPVYNPQPTCPLLAELGAQHP